VNRYSCQRKSRLRFQSGGRMLLPWLLWLDIPWNSTVISCWFMVCFLLISLQLWLGVVTCLIYTTVRVMQITKMELQQQQQQLISMEGFDGSTVRVLVSRLINVVLALLAVILVFVHTGIHLLGPFLNTRYVILAVSLLCDDFAHFSLGFNELHCSQNQGFSFCIILVYLNSI